MEASNSNSGGIIYNVTVHVSASIAEPWFNWLVTEHIPDVMATKCFESYRVVKLLDIDTSEGPTYAIQYHAASKADYNRYIELYADELRKKGHDKWADKFISFRTLMEIVH